jgi:hypothetical protein
MEKLQKLADMKGLTLVNEQWLVDRIVEGDQVGVPGKGTKAAVSVPAPAAAPAKANAAVKVAAPPAPPAKAAASSASSAGGDGIRGLTFAITGRIH